MVFACIGVSFKYKPSMQAYLNLGRRSGVAAYEYGEDWIQVKFTKGGTYEYKYDRAGSAKVEKMKELADAGSGLNAYINTTVKKLYSRKVA